MYKNELLLSSVLQYVSCSEGSEVDPDVPTSMASSMYNVDVDSVAALAVKQQTDMYDAAMVDLAKMEEAEALDTLLGLATGTVNPERVPVDYPGVKLMAEFKHFQHVQLRKNRIYNQSEYTEILDAFSKKYRDSSPYPLTPDKLWELTRPMRYHDLLTNNRVDRMDSTGHSYFLFSFRLDANAIVRLFSALPHIVEDSEAVEVIGLLLPFFQMPKFTVLSF